MHNWSKCDGFIFFQLYNNYCYALFFCSVVLLFDVYALLLRMQFAYTTELNWENFQRWEKFPAASYCRRAVDAVVIVVRTAEKQLLQWKMTWHVVTNEITDRSPMQIIQRWTRASFYCMQNMVAVRKKKQKSVENLGQKFWIKHYRTRVFLP